MDVRAAGHYQAAQRERVFSFAFMALEIDYDGHKVNSFKKTHIPKKELAMNKHSFLEHITQVA